MQNSTVTKSRGSGTVTHLRSRSSMAKCEEIEVGGISQSASVIESEDVEEESDEEDQEARDQCQNEEVRSRQGGTEEQTQVEDQVEERTFHHHRADGSQGTRR